MEIVEIDLRDSILDLIVLSVALYLKIGWLTDGIKKIDLREPYIDALKNIVFVSKLPLFVAKLLFRLCRDRMKKVYLEGFIMSREYNDAYFLKRVDEHKERLLNIMKKHDID